jgi:hypothetical protein
MDTKTTHTMVNNDGSITVRCDGQEIILDMSKNGHKSFLAAAVTQRVKARGRSPKLANENLAALVNEVRLVSFPQWVLGRLPVWLLENGLQDNIKEFFDLAYSNGQWWLDHSPEARPNTTTQNALFSAFAREHKFID